MAREMKKKKLGSSDLEVPIVCLGTMTFGEQCDEALSFEIMDAAMARGVNFLDTAELYPVPPTRENNARTEMIIGRWLEARGNRDQVILATKAASVMPGMDRSYIVANRSDPPADTDEQPCLTRNQILSACDASLRRLRTNYIDLYQLHWPARYVPCFGTRAYDPAKERDCPSMDEQVGAIGELLAAGKIRHWGLSNETAYGVVMMCETAKRLGVAPPISIQNDFSPFLRLFAGETAEACAPRNCNLGLLAYGVLAGGALSGKYLNGTDTSAARHTKFPGFQPRYNAPRSSAAVADLVALAATKGLTGAQLAQAWAASRWYMGSVIIGATSVAQLLENIDACLLDIDAATEAALDQLYIKHGNTTLCD